MERINQYQWIRKKKIVLKSNEKNMNQLELIYNLCDHRCKIRITQYKKKCKD